ncbi:cation diffusion facilitator family transporter [Oceanirhabdus sp. W0125-5]|uniref:cation diffusion facilitator family transporter n=1 Tax=Oceanirhabdus sp. W0125-5 TaxID=2999116 RepID=UPI0022F2E7C9|nr:cation diffusion facilitator family transporter [Oceanirhabdus sp. W0125-5]WBW99219.1 cation diffusion facilitator family transporter [Oceanirhabdus sp. W0125-5]
MQKNTITIANRISRVTIIWNVILAVIKLFIGFLGRSSALISDGIHSFSDVISTFCVLVGLKLSQKPEDSDHPYGHEKFEPILTKILAFILFLTAISIGMTAIKNILAGNYTTPSSITIIAALFSIGIKEWMYHYTLKGANKINSSALKADAWHHRTDALSSIGSLIGIVGALIGYPICDSLASIIICLIILKASIDIFLQAANQLVDKATDENTINNIKNIIFSVEGVLSIDSLKTRIHSNRLYIDLEISADKNLSFVKAHNIAEKVHNNIEEQIEIVKHCTVHINPK